MVQRAYGVPRLIEGLGVPKPFLVALALVYGTIVAGTALLGGSASHLCADLGVTLSLALFVAASIHAATRNTNEVRLAWGLVATGGALILLGQLCWNGYVAAGPIPASPTLNDVGSLSAIPLFIAGFICLGDRRRMARLLVSLDIVGLTFSLGIFFFAIFWPEFAHSPFSAATRVTLLLYPVAYAALAGAIWFLPCRTLWSPGSRLLVMGGLSAYIASAVIACPSTLVSGFSDNVIADLLAMATGLLVTGGALTFHPVAPPRYRDQMLGPTAWVTVVASTGALCAGFWRWHAQSLSPVMVQVLGILYIGMLSLMGVRLALTLTHGQHLVGEIRRTVRALKQSEELFRALFQHSPDGIFLIDPANREVPMRIVDCNQVAAAMSGYEREELIGRSFQVINGNANMAQEVDGFIQRIKDAGVLVDQDGHIHRDGTKYWVEYSTSIVTLGDRELLLGIDRDITERKRAQEALAHQATHDALTDLPNRVLLRDRLSAALAAPHGVGALLFMDLDRFKEVNDSYGHQTGDEVLKAIACRVRTVVRTTDTVARLGGDEFAVLLLDADADGATQVMRTISAAFEQSLEIGGHVLDIGTSIGCALFPDQGHDVSTLMRRADIAMYAAKRGSLRYTQYRADHERSSPERLQLIHDLRTAIDGEGLRLHYQPLLNLEAGSVERVEALVRWQHPSHGLISPDRFVPEAEETGLIEPLTRWVLNEALRQRADWGRAGLRTGVSVNLSARTLHNPGAAIHIAGLLERWQIDPRDLTLEITESALMLEPDAALLSLEQIHALGVRVAIDDFGTGYSSLSRLKRLPVDQIKVDRSFVIDMTSNEDSAAIVRSVLDLGHNLGLQVVAEGVEDQHTADVLQALGCDLLQGYHISRPAAPDVITAWLPGAPTVLRRLA